MAMEDMLSLGLGVTKKPFEFFDPSACSDTLLGHFLDALPHRSTLSLVLAYQLPGRIVDLLNMRFSLPTGVKNSLRGLPFNVSGMAFGIGNPLPGLVHNGGCPPLGVFRLSSRGGGPCLSGTTVLRNATKEL